MCDSHPVEALEVLKRESVRYKDFLGDVSANADTERELAHATLSRAFTTKFETLAGRVIEMKSKDKTSRLHDIIHDFTSKSQQDANASVNKKLWANMDVLLK